MPKKQNVSEEFMADLERRADDVDADIANMLDAIRSDRMDELEKPFEMAKTFAMLASRAASMAQMLITKAQMDEQKRRLDELKRNVA